MPQLKSLPRPWRRYPRISYEQFLNWDGENQHVEWVDGTVIPMPPISDEHTDVGAFLIAILLSFVQHHRIGTIKYDPFQMKTGPGSPGRAPDILFVANRNRRRLHSTFLEGPADLVVEIISPDSRTIDRVTKFREYEEGGVREYWLIDPARRRAEFYRRGRDGRFSLMAPDMQGVFRSAVMKGLWLKVDWLWAQPDVAAVLKEWGIV
jgi:Uma2 family endonuclease